VGPRLFDDDEAGRAEAVRVLSAGGVVGLPTDTVYGIAVALATPGGVERLFAVKDRPPDKAIMVLVDDVGQAAGLVEIPNVARRLADRYWPGGLSLVLPLRDGIVLPAALTAGTATLGIRMPAHPCPRALARELGPLPTTSANRSGEPEGRSARDVVDTIGDRIDLVVDGGPSAGGTASTVVDCTGPTPRILREGAISRAEIVSLLEEGPNGSQPDR
jgi:L-threonylcarbamoyladenylate synthase